MTDAAISNPVKPENTLDTSLGAVLFTGRTAKNLTVKEVSNQLRLSVAQIEALESDNFAALPQAMATRGFIRNYARLLDLDAEPLLARYRALIPDNVPSVLSVQTSMQQVMISSNGKPKFIYILSAMLLLLTVLLWLFYANYSVKSDLTSVNQLANASHEQAAESLTLPEIALPAAERQPAAMPAEQDALTVSATAATEAEKANTTQENVASSRQAAATLKPNIAETAHGNSLSISVTEETWIQVKDKAGVVLYEKKLAANSSDSINGLPPLYLWVGNVKATTVTFLGKTVDLSNHTKNNIARITLE